MRIDTVDWKLTGVCNLRCLHCYGPPKKQRSLPLGQLLEVVERLSILGIRRLVFTGGEPLLVDGIETVLAHVAERNIAIALSTNTSCFWKRKKSIERYVQSLNIPLDGHTPEIHARSRMETGSFYTCLEILRYYQQHPHKKPPLLRIGTVFSRANAGTFLQLGSLLESFSSVISTWKIYELMDYEFQHDIRKQLLHARADFESEMIRLLTSSAFSSKIMVSGAESRDRAFFMLNPAAQLVLPTNDGGVTREIVLGDFLNDPIQELVAKWFEKVDLDKYHSNHEGHYGA
jgi:MoaA/NifB/PqqE/SkfB family radical SAM enzyme